MMGAARMMYLWLQLLRKDISRGSNKVPLVKPSTKYDRPQLLPSNGNASYSSYVTMMDVAPIIHHRPQQILCKNVGCGSNEMPSDLPSTNYNLPWLLCNNFSYSSYTTMMGAARTMYLWSKLLRNNVGPAFYKLQSDMVPMQQFQLQLLHNNIGFG